MQYIFLNGFAECQRAGKLPASLRRCRGFEIYITKSLTPEPTPPTTQYLAQNTQNEWEFQTFRTFLAQIKLSEWNFLRAKRFLAEFALSEWIFPLNSLTKDVFSHFVYTIHKYSLIYYVLSHLALLSMANF